MYNSELKNKFISEIDMSDSRRIYIQRLFTALEPFEEAYNTDVCAMDEKILKDVLGKVLGFKESSKRTGVLALKGYIKWCKNNDVEGVCDSIFNIKSISLDKMKHQMVANPYHLQKYLDFVFDKESECTADNVYRCYFWLAYAGLDEEDAVLVKDTDVDLTDMIIRYNGNDYPIYREALLTFKNCIELKEFNYIHPNQLRGKRERIEGNLLLRRLKKAGNTEMSESYYAIRPIVSKRIKIALKESENEEIDENLRLKLSYSRVQLSGIFYTTYEAERAGNAVDFTPLVEKMIKKDDNYMHLREDLRRRKKTSIIRSYLKDYNNWKEIYTV